MAAELVEIRAATTAMIRLTSLARIVAHARYGQEPEGFTTAPICSVQKVLFKAGWAVKDVQLWEVNEAFAVVPMALMTELKVADEIVDVNGGGCALGHPNGRSRARRIADPMPAMKAPRPNQGRAPPSIGGGGPRGDDR